MKKQILILSVLFVTGIAGLFVVNNYKTLCSLKLLSLQYDRVKHIKYKDGKLKADEWVVRAGYKYNDKLSFKAWYSMITAKQGDVKNKGNRFRFDARYNF